MGRWSSSARFGVCGRMGRKRTIRSGEWVAQVIDAYGKGRPIIRIAGELGVSEKTVSRVLRENGIEIRPR
jgi:transposase-like protein